MNKIDNFWLSNLKNYLKDLDFDEAISNKNNIKEALKNIRAFVSTNVSNKIIINQKTDISAKLLNLTWAACAKYKAIDNVAGDIDDDGEIEFMNELLSVLNSFSVGISKFRDKLIDKRFIELLVSSIINEYSKFRCSSIIILRTLLNARNIHNCLKPGAQIIQVLQEVITPDIMRKLIQLPNNITKCYLLNIRKPSLIEESGNHLIDKRTNLMIFEILSVLATDCQLNGLMFKNAEDFLLKSFNSMLTELEEFTVSQKFIQQPEVRYILKCLVFYFYFEKQSLVNLQKIYPYSDNPLLYLKLYGKLQWIDDKSILPLLGLLRGLLFIRLRELKANRTNTLVTGTAYEGLDISYDEILKNIIVPLTYNETYIEFNGVSSWLLHVLYLVLRQEISLSDMVMECNEFVLIIDRNLTLKIQSSKSTECNSKKKYSKTGTVSLINLIHLLKLLAWMSSESDTVKHRIGNCKFIVKILDCLHDDYSNLLIEFSHNIREFKTVQPEQMECIKSRIKSILEKFSIQDLDLHKTIWLLFQSLSKHFGLHRSFFSHLVKHATFIKDLTEFYLDCAVGIQFIYTSGQTDSLGVPEPLINEYRKLVIETLKFALTAVSNLILPTSPLKSDLLDWSVKLFIEITNGGILTSALSLEYPEVKLCGLRGLVNASYSIVAVDRFQNIIPGSISIPAVERPPSTILIDSSTTTSARRRRRRTFMENSSSTGDSYLTPNIIDRSSSPLNLPISFGMSLMEEHQQTQNETDIIIPQHHPAMLPTSQPAVELNVSFELAVTAGHDHPELQQQLTQICAHLIRTMPSSLSTSTPQTNANASHTSFTSPSNDMTGESRISNLPYEPLPPDPLQSEALGDHMMLDNASGTAQNIDNNKGHHYNEIHDKIVWMVWSLLRNTLHSPEAIEDIVLQHGVEIINFIISTLESNHSYPVKEQALIALGHMSTDKDFRRNLLENEDLMEKIKLFSRSPYYPLKSAAAFATFYLNELYDKDIQEVSYAEGLRNDCLEMWEYWENINKLL